MIQRTIRTLLSAFVLGLAPAAAHAQLGAPTVVTYHLEGPSSFQEGCLPPCLCPILFYDNLLGTFDLTQVLPCPPTITCFTLTNIDWVMVDSFGVQRTVTGTGTYQLRDPQHRLELDVSIDGGPLQHHDSGPVPGGLDFPRIDIAAALNDFVCYDEVFRLHASADLYTNYCMANPTSAGGPSIMSASGSASIAANDLVISCDNIPGSEPGVFFYGANQGQFPFGEGNRCITGTIIRIWPPSGSSGGVLTRVIDYNTLPTPIISGSTWNFQGWFRDPSGGPAGFNLSDGIEIVFVP
jgi:hypothetical protein